MNNGLTVIKALLSYDQFSKYGPLVLKVENLDKELKQILKTIRDYYQKYKTETISAEDLETFFYFQYPALPDVDIYKILFEKIKKIPSDNEGLITDVLHQFLEIHYMTKIAQEANAVVQESKSTAVESVQKILDDYKDLVGNLSDIQNDVCKLSIAEIYGAKATEGLNWRLPFLNNILGPLKSQTLGHIFARPDVGKTSFAISEGTFFAQQVHLIDRPILYCTNEEAVGRVLGRAHCAFFNVTEEWLIEHPTKADALWKEHAERYVKFVPKVQWLHDVEKYLKAFNPRVCFIDQGPKLQCHIKGDNDVARLQKIYNTLRGWGEDYDCSIITLGQADSASEGRRILGLHNLDRSKVAVPGELDWCVGIGFTNETGQEEVRHINVCKNKLTGRRANDAVLLDIGRCRFKSFEDN